VAQLDVGSASALFRQLVRARHAGRATASAAFAESRFDEGARTAALVRRLFPGVLAGRCTVLDLGSGNGGMLFPFAATGRAVALDTYVDRDLRSFAAASGLPVRHVLGSAEDLPLADGSVDLVIFAEVLEHLAKPRRAGAEIARVLKPGGVCMVSTPPRLVFAKRRDPHFGIPFLVALPDALQRAVVRRRYPGREREVSHIYATTWGVLRQFPRGRLKMHVVSHRRNWTRHLSWSYIALERVGP
jgi:SAM-dependent methyltransferase